jgi:cytochrome c-type biogenesis protein CcmF
VTLGALLALSATAARPFALAMFALAAFVLASVAQELWRGASARRATTRELLPVAVGRLIRRNRRRYGGYIVHAGLAVLLVGVAASSSFAHSSDVVLKPGQTAKVGGYRFRYMRPTAAVSPQKLSFGAVLDVSKGKKHVTTLDTSRGFYPSQDSSQGIIGRFFAGQADSDVGLKAGLTHDIWTVANPDLSPLQGLISQGDRVFQSAVMQAMQQMAARHVAPSQAMKALAPLWQQRDQAIAGIVARYISHPWAINFLLIVSPLVTWIWLGALIILTGGLIALWPAPTPARRRARAQRRAPAAPGPAEAPAPAAAAASMAVGKPA